MSDNIFVDTNILVDAVADDRRKRDIADKLLLSHDIVVSAQVISEFIAVTIRKHILKPPKAIEYAKQFMQGYSTDQKHDYFSRRSDGQIPLLVLG